MVQRSAYFSVLKRSAASLHRVYHRSGVDVNSWDDQVVNSACRDGLADLCVLALVFGVGGVQVLLFQECAELFPRSSFVPQCSNTHSTGFFNSPTPSLISRERTEREEKLQRQVGGDAPEGPVVKAKKVSSALSLDEWDGHLAAGRAEYRGWCPFCVADKRKGEAHRRIEASRDHGHPELHLKFRLRR